MTDNYFEYAVEEKTTGKNRRLRTLLIFSYVLFSVLFFFLFCIIHIPQVIALLPFLLWIFVFYTWQYVSVTHEYIIATGEIRFCHIYGNRKRKEVLALPIRDIRAMIPAVQHTQGRDEVVFDFRSAADAPDSYCLFFRDRQDRACVVYFEATPKALRLLQMYNPAALSRMGR